MRQEVMADILRDMNDGVLLLDFGGNVLFLNEKCKNMLGITQNITAKNYAEWLPECVCKKKEKPLRAFISSALEKGEKCEGKELSFVCAGGEKRNFDASASVFLNEETGEAMGVVFLLTDVTELAKMRRKSKDATVVFASLISCLCVYLFLWRILTFFNIKLSTDEKTNIVHGIVLILAVIIFTKTEFSVSEIGIGIKEPKKTILTAVLISAGVVAAMCLLKLCIMKVAPTYFSPNRPFWKWNIRGDLYYTYILTCILQEFLARSVIQESLRRILHEEHAGTLSLVLSALLFGVVHIAHGLMYMLGATILLGALGGLYNKQRSVWGVAIIHYVLGISGWCLGIL
ncbi:MAG: CPBP family intramembrane metalloprotease [Clostridia bacterium]|nr:CPBP family intramembrane metalloprotease [Clostridia bacterium]